MNLFHVLAHNDPLYPLQPSAKLWHLAELHKIATGRYAPWKRYAKDEQGRPYRVLDLPVSDLPGVQLRWSKANVAEGPTKGRVLDHIGFDVKDLKAFIAKSEAAGVKLDADGAYRVNDVGVGIAFITDPWGTRIELNERPKAVYLP